MMEGRLILRARSERLRHSKRINERAMSRIRLEWDNKYITTTLLQSEVAENENILSLAEDWHCRARTAVAQKISDWRKTSDWCMVPDRYPMLLQFSNLSLWELVKITRLTFDVLVWPILEKEPRYFTDYLISRAASAFGPSVSRILPCLRYVMGWRRIPCGHPQDADFGMHECDGSLEGHP